METSCSKNYRSCQFVNLKNDFAFFVKKKKTNLKMSDGKKREFDLQEGEHGC